MDRKSLKSKGRVALWTGWVLSLGLAAACIAVLATEARQDAVAVPLDFSRVSGWQSAGFRVWGEDTYTLAVRSENRDPEYVGRFLVADFRVRVLGAEGQPVMDRLYRGENLDHTVPAGRADVALARLEVQGRPWRPGRLQVRVAEPDPAFRTTRSELRLQEEPPGDGMAGVVRHPMAVPAAILMVLGLVLAAVLARRGARWPLLVTGLAALGVLAALAGLGLG